MEAEANELCRKIERAVGEVMREHEAQTGWTPSSIDIEMIQVTAVGDEFPRFAVGMAHITDPFHDSVELEIQDDDASA